MSIKISELPEATSVSQSDLIPIVQNGTTKKATAGIINTDNYSTSEQLVGTWINGKPLYEQTISTEAPEVSTDGTDVNKQIDISNTIDFSFISFQIAYSSNQSFPLPYVVLATPLKRMTCRTDKVSSGMTRITILSNGTAFNGKTVVATIRYTKTTDTATRSLNLSKGISGDEELGEKVEEQLLTPVEDEKELKKDILDDKEELKKADIEDVDIKSENIESGDKLEDVSDEQANKPTDI